MRIFNLSAVIALSAVSFLSAGVTLTPNVRAGVNFSNLIGGDRKDPKVLDGFDISFKNGFVGGAGLDVSFGNPLSIEPSVLFSSKGFTSTLKGESKSSVWTTSLSYVEMPILFKVTPQSLAVKPMFYVGPTFAIELSEDVEVETYEGDAVDMGEVVNKDVYNNFDIGIAAGAGLVIPGNYGGFMIDFRYTFGLSDIQNLPDNAPANVTVADIQNGTMSVMLGYEFGFLK